jgi:hypothetical protein
MFLISGVGVKEVEVVACISDLWGVFGIFPKEANIGEPGFTNVIYSGMVVVPWEMLALPNAYLLEVFRESGWAVTACVDSSLYGSIPPKLLNLPRRYRAPP